jgi:hypothetical protein
VLEDPGGRVMGFHRVIPGEPAVLEDLWLEPESIGVGLGRRLWGHAVAVALAFGAAALELDAEPNAVGFYERMGAVTVGSTASVLPGRRLPRMRLVLRRPDAGQTPSEIASGGTEFHIKGLHVSQIDRSVRQGHRQGSLPITDELRRMIGRST